MYEDLGYEADCPLLVRVMPGISDQARNGLYRHGSLRGSRFGFCISKREKRRRRVRGMGRKEQKKIDAGGRGGLVTRCFTTPSPLLLFLFFCSRSHVSHVLLACLGNGIACLRECEFLGNCLSAPATQATVFHADC